MQLLHFATVRSRVDVYFGDLSILHGSQYIGTFKDGANKLVWALFHFPGGKSGH